MELNNYMMFGNYTTLSIVTAVIIICIYYYISKTRGILPGPVGLPVIGYWPLLKMDTFHLTLQKLQEKYGDLFSFSFAGALYINMGSVKAIRDVQVTKAEYFERIHDFNLFGEIFKDGIFYISGEEWKVQRKFMSQKFKELGMTTIKESLGTPMYQSVQEAVDYLKLTEGKPVNIMSLITDKCNAILRRTMFGENGITEKEVKDLMESYEHVAASMTVANTMYCGALAKYVIFPLSSVYRNAMLHHKRMIETLKQIVDRYKLSFNEEHPRNIIDAFIKERNARQSKGDPTAHYFRDEVLIGNLLQFISDGVLAVAGFVNLFLLQMVEHQNIQEKVYAEIMEVIGEGREPTLDDKSKMQYTSSVILEVIRRADFFPALPTLQCIKETTIRGYRIPKGAIAVMNLYACHNDRNVYDSPNEFDPTRFMPKEGGHRPELPVMFGVGRRSCLGEGFTMAQIFLFMTTIVKHFKLSVAGNDMSNYFELVVSGKIEIVVHSRS